ncbi:MULTISPECIES: hypothetical protein [Aminobacter]|uniref:hypothetical protein n=1 Tax=Aminobacter TaxID=31988 RepID=UPI0012B09A04|nr:MULTISPECIES: hypothetical protein [Aminobacter]MBA8908275.1 hypothetical protein [Aminobacter ciceronei]QNH34810.1 hypothetical protein H5P29_02370 [Aminobacter sp. MDW-2]
MFGKLQDEQGADAKSANDVELAPEAPEPDAENVALADGGAGAPEGEPFNVAAE